jgi:pimeloyl-ACP methyl ester carboxylesterase
MGFVHFGKGLRGMTATEPVPAREVMLPPLGLPGTLRLPSEAKALIVLVHASGSSYANPRHRTVAQAFNQRGFATLLVDLVSAGEDDRQVPSNVGALAERLCGITEWIETEPQLRGLGIGYFAGNSGAAAAFAAAARLERRVGAVVSRGGRPDLAGDCLDDFSTPALLIVGGQDSAVIASNEEALARLKGPKEIEIIAGASHFFTEPGALTAVAAHATQWFDHRLMKSASAGTPAHCGN